MQHQKREFKLICADQFFGERSNGIGVKLRIRRSEVDQVIGVAKHRQQFTTLDMIEKSADFLAASAVWQTTACCFSQTFASRCSGSIARAR